MTEYEVPEHMRLYVDAIRTLPLPGERMTVEAYEDTRELLLPTSDALRELLSERDKLDGMLREAGIEYPLGLRGVDDLVSQRDGHRQRAEEAEAERDTLAAQVQAVRELADREDELGSHLVTTDEIHRALDGTDR